jgi:hypothetical protein
MFEKYVSTVLEIADAHGVFDTNPLNAVRVILQTLAGLVQADQIATQGEVEDATTVRTAEETTLHDVKVSVVDALNRTRVLKAFSGQADLPQGYSDELWREVDLLQADLELALDRIDPRELEDWLNSRW